ncbi:MAG: WGR domain-containing protein [Gemmobacter sp.]|jgi:predicted DNA-binding WGR domain protein|nr:WGR domain-containing protein [Gemmobacter sp.]
MSDSIHLQRINPALNQRRFYRICLQANLFGGIDLWREWGRIGSTGRLRIEPCADESDARARQDRLAERKIRRGYERL